MDLKQAFFPAETQRAPEVIYDQIYQQIASGQLKPGDRLPSERVLAEQFQRSRHVIREALRMLQQDGLITVEVGSAGGSIVQQVSADLLGTPLKHYLADGGLSLLELTEYRDYSPQTIQIQQAATETTPAVATTEPSRAIPAGEITVGAVCIANGPYYSSSYGDEPHGNGNGRRAVVSRVVDGSRPYPVHINSEAGGALGWASKDSLQVVTA